MPKIWKKLSGFQQIFILIDISGEGRYFAQLMDKQLELPLIYDLTHIELRDFLVSKGFGAYVADQIFDWLYRKLEFDLDNWSNVGKKIKGYLTDHFRIEPPTIIWNGLSKDGTRKFLVKMNDGKTVETVAIPAKERLTLCISSQVGCAIGCTFCHTGTQGLTRNLSTGEIIGQYMAVVKFLKEEVRTQKRLTNIVYMGQGEPLHNFDNARKSCEVFLDPKGIGLGQRKVTVSTSGLVPAIKKLKDFPPVNFAISLHAAHNDIRSELMPINKVYDLERLFDAIGEIPLKAHRRITYEYLLIEDYNDRDSDIDALTKLLKRSESKINIIPFNEYPGSNFKRPTDEKIDWFNEQLNVRGFTSTIRTTKGSDILAACGQLKTEYEKLNVW